MADSIDIVALVDADLKAFLNDVTTDLPDAKPMIEAISNLVDAGGKRLRPRFCYWGFRIFHPHVEEIISAGTALELLHTFALIHDDIMDRSVLRRGRPTVHAEHGLDFAILAGDLALVLADRALFEAGWEAEVAMSAFAPYSQMRQEVIAGQFLDVAAGRTETLSEDQARHIAVMKSGRYSVRMPLVIGATLAGADADQVESVAAFGDPLGESFQLRDDLLGSFGYEESTGKPVDSDIREGKRNYLFAAATARLSGEELTFFKTRWGAGDDLSDEDVQSLRTLLGSSGARAATEKLQTSLRTQALDRLDAVSADEPVQAALRQLIDDATLLETE